MSKFKELEILFSWSEFYSNGKNLAVETYPNQDKFEEVKQKIIKLKQKLKL